MLTLMPTVVNGAPCFSSQCAVQEAAAPVIATASSFLLGVALRIQPQDLETATLKVCGEAFPSRAVESRALTRRTHCPRT